MKMKSLNKMSSKHNMNLLKSLFLLLLFAASLKSCKTRFSQMPLESDPNLFGQSTNAIFVMSLGDVATRKMLDCWIGLKATKSKGRYSFDVSAPEFYTKRFVYREKITAQLENLHQTKASPGWFGEIFAPIAAALGVYGAVQVSGSDAGWVTTLFWSWTAASGAGITARHLLHVQFAKEMDFVHSNSQLLLLDEGTNPIPPKASQEFINFLKETDEYSGQRNDRYSRDSEDPVESQIRTQLSPKEYICAKAFEPWKKAKMSMETKGN